MGQFKPMVKMETTEPSVELKLKKGGCVTSAKKMMSGGSMGALSMAPAGARGGMNPVARPAMPSMMAKRKAMMGKPMMAEGGEAKSVHKAEMSKMKGLEKELKSHESKPASKGHKGLKTGGVVQGAGGFATGGVVNNQPAGYKKGGMATGGKMPMKGGKPAFLAKGMMKGGMACATGGVADSNAGGYKKGGAPKKHYATGGLVNSGKAVAMPQKAPSKPVSNDRQSGTFKKGGEVKMKAGGATQAELDKAYEGSIGPSKEDMDMANTIRDIPGRLFRGAKKLIGMDEKPKAGAVTKTEKSITVAPGKKRGGSVKC